MGLQISFGMDDEVSIRGVGGGYRAAGEGALARDSAQYGVDDSCGGDQPKSCAPIDIDTAEYIGIACGDVLEGQEFVQVVKRIHELEETLLGAAPVGPRVLGRL